MSHPDYLYQQLSGRQLAEWKAYSQIEPFGWRAMWMPFAMLALVISQVFQGRRSRAKFDDFMPEDPDREKKAQSWESIGSALRAMAHAGERDRQMQEAQKRKLKKKRHDRAKG